VEPEGLPVEPQDVLRGLASDALKVARDRNNADAEDLRDCFHAEAVLAELGGGRTASGGLLEDEGPFHAAGG
jgi:hypothetical protein